MVPVQIAVNVTDACSGGATCAIVSVSSNEAQNGLGDGDTAPDWEITGKLALNVRAERAGGGSGRVYTVTIRCTDAAGNAALREVRIQVPQSRRRR